MISFLIIFLHIAAAAFCKAVADTIAHHYAGSIFRFWKNQRFWDLAESNKNPLYIKGSKYKFDCWHVANSLMIFLLLSAIPLALLTYKSQPNFHWIFDYAIVVGGGGLVWIFTFNPFYNKWLLKK